MRFIYYVPHASIMWHLGSEAADFWQYLDNSDLRTRNGFHPFQCNNQKVNSKRLKCLATWQILSAQRQDLPCI